MKNVNMDKSGLKSISPELVLRLFLFRFIYLFTMVLIGACIVAIYGYFWSFDISSPNSTLIIAGIFAAFAITDLLLLYNERLAPTLLILLILISPIYTVYKALKSSELFNINTTTPARVKKYVLHTPDYLQRGYV
jgi:hypothetical protein